MKLFVVAYSRGKSQSEWQANGESASMAGQPSDRGRLKEQNSRPIRHVKSLDLSLRPGAHPTDGAEGIVFVLSVR